MKRSNKSDQNPKIFSPPNLSQTCESTESSGREQSRCSTEKGNNVKTKNVAVGEGEYGDLKGMGLLQPRGLRQGARGKRRGGLCCLGGGTTGNDRIIRKSIWQEINTVWARSPRGSKPDIVENYNKPCWKGYENLSYHAALESTDKYSHLKC